MFRSYEHPMNIETISTPATVALRSLILVLVAGETHLRSGDSVIRLRPGRTLLIPAMTPSRVRTAYLQTIPGSLAGRFTSQAAGFGGSPWLQGPHRPEDFPAAVRELLEHRQHSATRMLVRDSSALDG